MKSSRAKKHHICRSNLRSNEILVRGSSELQDRGPEAATERHGGDLVVPVRVGHAGVAEAGEVVAAAARRRRHAPLLEVLLVPVVAAAFVTYSIYLSFSIFCGLGLRN